MNKQKGNVILSIMVTMIAASLWMSLMASTSSSKTSVMTAISYGDALNQVCESANTWATRNWTTVLEKNGLDVPIKSLLGVGPISPDTIFTLGNVPIHISVGLKPVGCTGASCYADIRVWTEGFKINGRADIVMASNIQKRVGKMASVSNPENPTVFTGWRSMTTYNNPTGQPAAVMLVCGDANIRDSDIKVKGNTALESEWTVSNSLSGLDRNESKTVRISAPISGGACSEEGALSVDMAGVRMLCDSGIWVSTNKPVTVEVSTSDTEYVK